jgi:hypothetical protein
MSFAERSEVSAGEVSAGEVSAGEVSAGERAWPTLSRRRSA